MKNEAKFGCSAYLILPVKPETLETICLKDVVPKVLEWFWQDRIPKNKQTIFSGNPDVGKTLVLCDIIAHYTTGRDWPDGTKNENKPGDVLLLSAEDSLEDTLTPRLIAADADLSRIHFVKLISLSTDKKQKRLLALDCDIERIENKLKENPQIGLVVIDPISSYLGKADMNKEQSLRSVLTPVGELAEEKRVTIIGNSHFNKRLDVSALHKVSGAVAMTGVARAVWLFARDDQDKALFHMLLGKGNLTRKRTGMKYRIAEVELPTGGTPVIAWEGEDDKDADEIISKAAGTPENAIDRAKAFIDEYVTIERASNDVSAVAESRGIKRTNLFAAKRSMPYIRAYRMGGQWFWYPDRSGKATESELPSEEAPESEVEF
jgi:putative DNA primase/helicase